MERVFFSRRLGACRRRTPRTRVDLKVPQDAPHRDLSDAPLRFDLALGVRRRHVPIFLLKKMDPCSGSPPLLAATSLASRTSSTSESRKIACATCSTNTVRQHHAAKAETTARLVLGRARQLLWPYASPPAVMAYIVMAYTVMAYTAMAHLQNAHLRQLKLPPDGLLDYARRTIALGRLKAVRLARHCNLCCPARFRIWVWSIKLWPLPCHCNLCCPARFRIWLWSIKLWPLPCHCHLCCPARFKYSYGL